MTKKHNETYPEKLERLTALRVVGTYHKASVHTNLECLLCGNRFKATPKSKVQNATQHGLKGCPDCTSTARYKNIRSENVKKLEERFIIVSDISHGYNNDTMVEVQNRECNHTFISKMGNLLNRDVNCPTCNSAKKAERCIAFSEEQHRIALIGKEGFEQYSSMVRVATEQTYRDSAHEINPHKHPRGRAGVEGAYHLDHIVSILSCYRRNVPPEICAHRDNLQMLAWKHNIVKGWSPTRRPPPIMWEYLNMHEERNVFASFIKQHIPHLRKYKGEYALDLMNRDKTVYIAFHCFDDILEQNVGNKKYLRNITEVFEEQGKRVLHFFEDEWKTTPELVLNKIKHILHCKSDNKRVYARQCTIREITAPEKRQLLEANHIQGVDSAQVNLGAFLGDELVSVMTFAKPRIFMKRKQVPEGLWELSRFASDSKYIVVGIASKLLSHFKKHNNWSEIYTFADLRWSSHSSNMYHAIGFTESQQPTIGYSYVVDYGREHRWKYRKQNLKQNFPEYYDSSKTEYEMMLSMGHDRIWDCGIQRYEMTNE